MTDVETVAVVGCGAMGSVYAGRFAAAGFDVLAVDRNVGHVDAMARDGLRVQGPDGEFTAALRATTEPPDESVDLVVLAVKAAGVDAAARAALPLVGPGTVVLTIQNGLGSADIAADVLGSDRVAVGIASGFGAARIGDGLVRHNAMRAVRMGTHGSVPPGRVEAVARAWRVAGFDAESVDDIAAMAWQKLICNVAYSAPCALTGLTVGGVLDDPDAHRVSAAAATEAWTVARALGVAIDADDPVELIRDFGAAMPNAKPSAMLDHEARRVSEIDVINGAVPRQAASVGLRAPVNETLTGLAKAIEAGFAH